MEVEMAASREFVLWRRRESLVFSATRTPGVGHPGKLEAGQPFPKLEW